MSQSIPVTDSFGTFPGDDELSQSSADHPSVGSGSAPAPTLSRGDEAEASSDGARLRRVRELLFGDSQAAQDEAHGSALAAAEARFQDALSAMEKRFDQRVDALKAELSQDVSAIRDQLDAQGTQKLERADLRDMLSELANRISD